MTGSPVIEGNRVRLRELSYDDAAALHDIYSDVELMTWWSHGPLETLAETQGRVQQSLAAEDWQRWAITLAGDDRAIGTLGAHQKRQGGVVEIGYSLARAHWGKGIAGEAVSLLIEYLFEVEGHRRVFADTDPDNIASNALLTRLGFTLEGRLREEWDTHIGVRDSYIWGLLRSEWKPPL